MKRKGVDEVSDDFFDFSLSSPATKIRRLILDDAELPPIVEEEKPSDLSEANQEKALVLFNPLLHSPSTSTLSLTLRSDFLSGVKNHQQLAWSKQCDSDCDRLILPSSAEAEEDELEKNKHRLALVPWAPSSQFPFQHAPCHDSTTNTESESKVMVAEEEMGGGEASVMEVEVEQQDTTSSSNSPTIHPGPATLNLHGAPEGFHQWRQQQQLQHCLIPHLPRNTSTPITWTR